MSIFGRVDSGNKLVEYIDYDPEGKFHPDVVWAEVPEDLLPLIAVSTLIYDGDEVKPESTVSVVADLKVSTADIRFAVEIGGISMPDGTKIKTDRESQAIIGGILIRMEKNPELTLDFKTASGWSTMDKALAEAVADAVAAHVQACFSREKAIDVALDAAADSGDFKDVLAAYESEKWQGWPTNSVYIQNREATLAATSE